MRPSGLGWPEPTSTSSPSKESSVSQSVLPPVRAVSAPLQAPVPPTAPPVVLSGEAKGAKRRWEWSGNALIAGVVSAVVAGGISLLVTHVQDRDSASQASASQQVQAAQSLEADANSFYEYTTDIYNFQRQCAGPYNTWRGCAAEAVQVYPNYNAVMSNFVAASSNVTDQAAEKFANQMASESAGLIATQSESDASNLGNEMVTAFSQLIPRCGQLIQSQ